MTSACHRPTWARKQHRKVITTYLSLSGWVLSVYEYLIRGRQFQCVLCWTQVTQLCAVADQFALCCQWQFNAQVFWATVDHCMVVDYWNRTICDQSWHKTFIRQTNFLHCQVLFWVFYCHTVKCCFVSIITKNLSIVTDNVCHWNVYQFITFCGYISHW